MANIRMELLWIPIALVAGLMQALRTAAQKALNARLSTWMTTYVRSIYGLPIMLGYLAVILQVEPYGTPSFTAEYLSYCAAAATSQVIATYLLIVLFQRSNFAVGTMLTKTDIMMAAIVGSVLFSEAISAMGWVAIVLSFVGVLLISTRKLDLSVRRAGLATMLVNRSALIGSASAFLFAMSYLCLREASLVMDAGTGLYRGAWSVVVVTSMQVVVLGLWLVATERAEFSKLPGLIGPSIFIGITSAIGSIGWFTAMALENASYVKAVGQSEIVYTILISIYYFRERITLRELAGIATIVFSILLFLI